MMGRDNKIILASAVETSEVYEAPVIEMIEVRVEKGFQITSPESERSAEEYTW